MSVLCFLMTQTARVRVSLCVYEGHRKCVAGPDSHGDYCQAYGVIVANAARSEWVEDLPNNTRRDRSELVSEDDPRWPPACDRCGVPLGESCTRQLWADPLWSGAPDGLLRIIREFPEGAMWDADWLHGYRGHVNADGLSLAVICPGGGEWHIDGPSSNGGGWARIGTPPAITVTPSIQTANYHGHLTAGVFIP